LAKFDPANMCQASSCLLVKMHWIHCVWVKPRLYFRSLQSL